MVNGGKLRGTIMANISVVCLYELEYILQEKIIYLFKEEIVSRVQQFLMEEKGCQRTLRETSALG